MHKSKIFSNIGYVIFKYLVFFSNLNIYSEDCIPDGQHAWGAVYECVDQGSDRAKPTNQTMDQVIDALNSVGIKTLAYSEGCLDGNLPYPWIDLEVSSVELDSFIAEYDKKLGRSEIEEALLKAKYPELSPLDREDQPEAIHLLQLREEARLACQSYKSAKALLLEPLEQFLDEFYENCTTFDERLILLSSACRLHSQGVNKQMVRSENDRVLKLMAYKEEMRAFARFLQSKLMSLN